MLIKIVKPTTVLALFISSLSAASFNSGAEKDRLDMIKFFEAKFEDPAKNKDRSFMKVGILNDKKELTTEGRESFIDWLFNTNKEQFKKEVVDKLLEAEEKKS